MNSRLLSVLGILAMLAGCDRAAPDPATQVEVSGSAIASAILGEWYNTEIGRYPTPSITVVKFHPAGGVVMGGLDGSQRYGQYSVAADGTLRVRIAERSRTSVIVEDEQQASATAPQLQTRPSRLIIDSIPVVTDQSLELQTRGRIFLFTRDPQQKARLDAGMLAYREAHAEALLRVEAARRQAEAAQETARRATLEQENGQEADDDVEEEDAPAPPRRVTLRFSGAGAGSSACTSALLQQISRPGLRVSAGDAVALVEVELSGIAYRRGTWGRYHEIAYRARIADARDHRVLAMLDATETASGSSVFEVCADIGEDIGDELEELLEIED